MLRIGLFLSLIAGAAIAASYTVTPIAIPNGYDFIGVSTINNRGQFAMTAFQGTLGQAQAFIGSTSGSFPVRFPPGNWIRSTAAAVNDAGQLVGVVYSTSALVSGVSQIFISSPAASSVITPPLGWNPHPNIPGISGSGLVTGDGLDRTNTSAAFLSNTQGSKPIPYSGGWLSINASSVNNSGQVAGSVLFADASFHAFVGTTSGSSLIPTPTGWSGAQVAVCGINDAGHVVGAMSDGNGLHDQAFIGTPASSIAIPLPAGATGVNLAAGCVNNSDVVVGTSDVGGWIWGPSTGTVLLNSLVPAGWNVNLGISISNNGYILAQTYDGQQSQVVVLTPSGPPSAPTLDYPTNSLTGTSITPTLRWEIAQGAASYLVYLGTSPSTLSLVAGVTTSTYTPAPLASNTTYYWAVSAISGAGDTPSEVFSFTTFNTACSFSASPSPVLISYLGVGQQINVTTGAGCTWTPTTSDSWLTVNSLGSGNGSGDFFVLGNSNRGSAQLAHVSFANQTVGVMQSGSPSAPIFDDVPPSYPYFDYISLLSNYGITAGCQASPPLYCPETPVTRAQMAVFVVAGLDLAMGTPLTYPSTAYFQDITASGPDSAYFPYVQRIAQLGITAGCQTSPALFCPDSQITQAQMAVFMIRAWMLANNLTTFSYPQTPYFTDVPASNQYFPFVQKMVQLGFWQGCTATVYCQGSPVTRGQTAPMIMRSMLGAP